VILSCFRGCLKACVKAMHTVSIGDMKLVISLNFALPESKRVLRLFLFDSLQLRCMQAGKYNIKMEWSERSYISTLHRL
jgi:hypothetical protein